MKLLLFVLVVGAMYAANAAYAGNALSSPDIGANFLGLYKSGSWAGSNDRTQAGHKGFNLQEAEFSFFADVDPYLRANILFSVAQGDKTTDYKIDPEEVFLETISLPVVTVKAGKFKAALGRHNTLHTHAFPFIDAPLISTALLGSEGLNDPGVSAAALLPTPWFSEFTAQVLSSGNDALFKSAKARDPAGVVHWKNLFDLSDSLTAEAGVSGALGRNQYDNNSKVWAGDLTMKWRPTVGGKYHSLIWSTEYLNGTRQGAVDSVSSLPTDRLSGFASWLQYQFAERWWLQGRSEISGLTKSAGLERTNKQSMLIAFFPSEFSGLRFQFDIVKPKSSDTANQVFAFQYNVTIGAHPAHNY